MWFSKVITNFEWTCCMWHLITMHFIYHQTFQSDDKSILKFKFRSLVNNSHLSSLLLIIHKFILSSIVQKLDVFFDCLKNRSIETNYCKIIVIDDANQIAIQYLNNFLHDFVQAKIFYQCRIITVFSFNIQSENMIEYIDIIDFQNKFWQFFIQTSFFFEIENIIHFFVFFSIIHSSKFLFFSIAQNVICVNIIFFSFLTITTKTFFFFWKIKYIYELSTMTLIRLTLTKLYTIWHHHYHSIFRKHHWRRIRDSNRKKNKRKH